MTREEALALYHPIRESIRRILQDAVQACNQSDFKRADKLLGLWADEKIVLPEGGEAADMLSDIALFEPNQRGRRAYDVFLTDKARQLDPGDFELAQRMGNAFFSVFRCTARHEVAGVWLDDLLDDNRRLWLMDQSMESSAPAAGAFGMRLFDAGEFHVGFGIVAPADDETTEFAIQGIRHNGRVPFRHSLAVTLYGDSLRDTTPLSPELDFTITSLLARTIERRANSRREIGARKRPYKTKPPHRD